jgi:hypothetical protein
MEPLLQLNLNRDSEKAEAENLPQLDREAPGPVAVTKSLNQIANRAAHRAASEYRRNSTGLFSK